MVFGKVMLCYYVINLPQGVKLRRHICKSPIYKLMHFPKSRTVPQLKYVALELNPLKQFTIPEKAPRLNDVRPFGETVRPFGHHRVDLFEFIAVILTHKSDNMPRIMFSINPQTRRWSRMLMKRR